MNLKKMEKAEDTINLWFRENQVHDDELEQL